LEAQIVKLGILLSLMGVFCHQAFAGTEHAFQIVRAEKYKSCPTCDDDRIALFDDQNNLRLFIGSDSTMPVTALIIPCPEADLKSSQCPGTAVHNISPSDLKTMRKAAARLLVNADCRFQWTSQLQALSSDPTIQGEVYTSIQPLGTCAL
jgi:hypothetical protein